MFVVTLVVGVVGFPELASATNVYLSPGLTLPSGGYIDTGTGCRLIVQATDGNLVEYCGPAVWASDSVGNAGDRLVMQGDGNAVLWTSDNRLIWSTGMWGYNGAIFMLQDDQNLVEYQNGVALWARSWIHDVVGSQIYAQKLFIHYGWNQSTEWPCLLNLWNRESGWRWNATNPSSGAYGIPQSLPANKMADHGTDWHNSGLTQVMWGEDYIRGRYGTACGAWNHEQQYGWY
jgi:hypothetical protein